MIIDDTLSTMKTVKEVAELLGVQRLTVYRWIKAGKLRVIRLPSGYIRVPDEELMRILEVKEEKEGQ